MIKRGLQFLQAFTPTIFRPGTQGGPPHLIRDMKIAPTVTMIIQVSIMYTGKGLGINTPSTSCLWAKENNFPL